MVGFGPSVQRLFPTGSAHGTDRGHPDIKMHPVACDEVIPLRAGLALKVLANPFVRGHRLLRERRAVDVLP